MKKAHSTTTALSRMHNVALWIGWHPDWPTRFASCPYIVEGLAAVAVARDADSVVDTDLCAGVAYLHAQQAFRAAREIFGFGKEL